MNKLQKESLHFINLEKVPVFSNKMKDYSTNILNLGTLPIAKLLIVKMRGHRSQWFYI